MVDSNQQVYAARQLLAGAFFGVISTHSREHPGYPFGSVVPYALDGTGLPVFLLSHLSQHTKNLDADPRCGLTIVETGEGDVQQRARLSALGDIEACDGEAAAERFFRYYPQSRMYFDELGFRFYRFRPLRFHWNGGFATARWFSQNRIVRPNPLRATEEADLLQHMTADHALAPKGYLREAGYQAADDMPVHMVGIDAEGLDLRREQELFRVPLARPIASPGEAREVLVEMAN